MRAPWTLVGSSFVVMALTLAIPMLLAFMELSTESPGLLVAAGQFISNLISIWLSVGQVKLGLRAARGDSVQLRTIFSGIDRVLPLIGAYILCMLLVALISIPLILGIGLNLVWLIILGGCITFFSYLYGYLALWPTFFFVIEGRTTVWNALQEAFRITRGHRLQTFLMGMISMVIMLMGYLALLIGVLVAIPITIILWSIFYSRLIGEPTVQAS